MNIHRTRALASVLALLAGAPSLTAQAVDTSRALGALRDFGQACARDAGGMWGHSLCGPIALVVPETRMIIANDTAAGRPFVPVAGAYISVLPTGLQLANTSFSWVNRQWAMVLMPALSGSRFDQLALLAHESFHREQSAIGLSGADALNPHLDERDARRLLRLELRALASALIAPDTAARRQAEDALLFRRLRRTLYPGADSTETALELAEGIAEYTGNAAALLLFPDSIAHVARNVAAVETRPSFVRSFAYGTGPALGLLLDRFAGPGWRRAFLDSARTAHPSLSGALARALHLSPAAMTRTALVRTVNQRAKRYDDVAIQGEETARAAARATRLAGYRARLVAGPVLELKQKRLQQSFNPNELIPLGDIGTIYPTGSFSAEWGSLEVTDGALVSADYQSVRVAAPAVGSTVAGREIKGPGWTLHLGAGWNIVPAPQRPGSLTVQQEKSS
jgi:hypothetical protein